MQALSAANRTSHGQSKIYNNNCSSCNPQAMNLTWNLGESRSGLTKSNLLACRRCLGPDLLPWTAWSFQGKDCNSWQTRSSLAGAEGGLCDSRGELETDLRCSWAGQIFFILKTSSRKLFWKLTCFFFKGLATVARALALWATKLPSPGFYSFQPLTSWYETGRHQHSPPRQDVRTTGRLHIRPSWLAVITLKIFARFPPRCLQESCH